MSSAMSSTLVRTFTALALLAIVLLDIYFVGFSGFRYLVFVIVFFLQFEYSNLVFKEYSAKIRNLFLTITLIISFLFSFSLASFFQYWALFLIIALCLLMFLNKHLSHVEQVKVFGLFGFGILYVGILPSLAIKVLETKYGAQVFASALAVIFTCDILAYFVGRKWGNKKIFPEISPNKSWAGAIGGLFGCVAVSFALLLIFGKMNKPLPAMSLFFVSVMAGILGQIGDFFESLFKRAFNQKDSSDLLPGHGGFLDRFDALLFILPLYYSYAVYLEKTYSF